MSSREFAHVSLEVLADTQTKTLNAWGRNDKFLKIQPKIVCTFGSHKPETWFFKI